MDILVKLKQICRVCLSWMQDHQEAHGWWKCICGFTKQKDPIITEEMYWMGRNVSYKQEWTPEIQQNAAELIEKVNNLLKYLKVKKEFWEDLPSGGKNTVISSGWRPGAVNREVGGAKGSAHVQGMAIDLFDTQSQTLANMITPEILEKFDLYMENPKKTRGKWTKWVHLQTRKAKSGRIFNP